MKKINFAICIMLFLASIFMAAKLAVSLPYIINWPFTGVLYGTTFLLIAILCIFLLKIDKDIPDKVDIKYIAKSALVTFLFISTFMNYTVRFGTENKISYAFKEGVVIDKYKSSNHGYLSFKIKSKESGLVSLEGYSQEFWNKVNIGDKVMKKFKSIELTPINITQKQLN